MSQKFFFKYLYLFLLVLVISCDNKSLQTIAEPPGLLTRENMAKVLADMHVVEAALQAKAYSADSVKALSEGYNQFIFEKHGVEQEQFKASFDYYLSNSLQMDTIMGFVIEELSNQEALSRGILNETLEVSPLPENIPVP
jgi:hypothetical protein